MERIRPAKRLGDNLYDTLASMIERQEVAEGARLPAETQLAQQFGVSRPIVRETLARLRDEGLIASRRGSGSYVQRRAQSLPPARPTFQQIDSFEQIEKCYEFRKAIEGEACFLAAKLRDDSQMEDIEQSILLLEKAIENRTVGSDADFQFHFRIAIASGNSWFISALEAMRSQIETTIEIARTLSLANSDAHIHAVQAEHVAIFSAIRRRDPVAARDAMRVHLSRTCERIFHGPAR